MIYAKLAAVVVLFAALAWGAIADYEAGKHSQAGTDAAELLKFKASIQAAADAQIAQVTKDKEAAIANNEGVINEVQNQLASMRDFNSQLSQRLRILTSTHSGSVSQGANQPPVASGTLPPTVGQIDDAIAATLTECAINRANYKALIAELNPQL